MRNRIVTLLLMICCAFSCAFMLVACGGDDPGKDNGGGGNTPSDTSSSVSSCIVNFDTRGGDSMASMNTTANNQDIVLAKPKKKAYEFMGWYDNASLTGDSITSIKAKSGTTNLYAKWRTIFEYESLGDTQCVVNRIRYDYYQDYNEECFYASSSIIDDYGANFTNVTYAHQSISPTYASIVEIVNVDGGSLYLEDNAIAGGFVKKIIAPSCSNGGSMSVFNKIVSSGTKETVEELVFTDVSAFSDSSTISPFGGFSKLKRIEFTDTSTIRGSIPQYFLYGLNIEEVVFDCEFFSVFSDYEYMIGQNAFQNCTKLKSIVIDSKIEKIERFAFANCALLEEVVFEGGSSLKEIGQSAFDSCKVLAHIDIPSTVEIIGDTAFQQCEILSNTTIPNGVKKIGSGAFYRCNNITEVTIPSSVEILGENIYNSNTNLERIVFEANDNIESIPTGLVVSCTKITELDFTPLTSATTMANAFSQCEALETLKLPSSLTTITDDMWLYYLPKLSDIQTNGCTAIIMDEGMIISNDGKVIYTAMPGSVYDTLTISSGVEEIGGYAFNKEGITIEHIVLPNSMKRLGERAFADISTLKTISLNQGLEQIDGGVFSGCSQIESVFIPKTVSAFSVGVFNHCTKLKTVEFEEGSLIEYMLPFLYDCPSLETLVVPFFGTYLDALSDTSIHYFFLDSVGKEKPNYHYAEMVSPNLTTIKALGGEKMCNYTLAGIDSIKNVYLPQCITTIEEDFLHYNPLNLSSDVNIILDFIESPITTNILAKTFSCTTTKTSISNTSGIGFKTQYIEKVILPSTVQTIYDSMFEGIPNLKEVVFEGDSKLRNIPMYCFRNSTKFTTFTIPSSVDSIRDEAFAFTSLSGTISIPKTTSLGNDVFLACKNIQGFEIESGHSRYSSKDGVLFDKTQVKLLQYPAGRVGEYYRVDSTVTSIGEYAFSYCQNLKHLDIASNAGLNRALIDVGESLDTITLSIDAVYTSVFSRGYAYSWFTDTGDSTVVNNTIKHIIFTNGSQSSELILHANALSALQGLESVELPSLVKQVVDGALYNQSLEEVTINNANMYKAITGSTGVNSFMTYLSKIYVLKAIVDDAANVNEYLNDTTMFTKTTSGEYYMYAKI